MFNLVKFLLSSKAIIKLLKIIIKDHLKFKCIYLYVYRYVHIIYNTYAIYMYVGTHIYTGLFYQRALLHYVFRGKKDFKLFLVGLYSADLRAIGFLK